MGRYRILGIISLFNISCSLSFTGGNIKGSIDIFPVQNESDAYGIEGILGSEIYNSFKNDGRFKISENGDYTLKVVVKGFKKEPFFYEKTGEVKGYKFTLLSDISFIRKSDTLKLLERSLREEIVSETNEDIEGIKKLAVKLKDDIIKIILELW
uniref:Uncharacterized protein n=1 Tax=candidate division WOR-3 bacterium TaxID=2052148 RepID=A0A7C4UD42_UNCW3